MFINPMSTTLAPTAHIIVPDYATPETSGDDCTWRYCEEITLHLDKLAMLENMVTQTVESCATYDDNSVIAQSADSYNITAHILHQLHDTIEKKTYAALDEHDDAHRVDLLCTIDNDAYKAVREMTRYTRTLIADFATLPLN